MDSSFLMPKFLIKLEWGHPQRRCQMQVGLVEIGDFRQVTRYNSKTSIVASVVNLVRSQGRGISVGLHPSPFSCLHWLPKLSNILKVKINTIRMWANAQRDGRPAKYRWRRLFNAAVWLTPTIRVPCSNAAKTWKPLKFAGVPKLANRSQPLVGRSSPYYEDMWRRYRCLTSFFQIVDTCLSCEDAAR